MNQPPTQKSIRFEAKTPELGIIYIDTPHKSVNILNQDTMMELRAAMNESKLIASLKTICFVSRKAQMFIAGADINEIAQIKDEAEAKKLVKIGQDIINEVADLLVETIAVIDGPCLGGGLELALACDYRIVTDHEKTSLGLPEVQLGIIPGFGGTQRLPRLICSQHAIELIASGSQIDAQKAVRWGIADQLIAHQQIEKGYLAFIQYLDKGGRAKLNAKRQKQQSPWNRVLHPIICQMAKYQTLKKTKGQYPAPISAINVIQKSRFLPLKKGLEIELEAFSKLVGTPVCKSLIQVFFGLEDLKKPPKDMVKNPIRSALVLGAGFMGGGIAWTLAQKELPVRLKDIAWGPISHALSTSHDIFQESVKRKKLTQTTANLRFANISGQTDFRGIEHHNIIFEAIPEILELKQNVLAELETHCNAHAIIASNTSALSITQIAAKLKHPERCIGFHFFSPVHRMPLVEVIPGEKTDPKVTQTMIAAALQMGKKPIVVKNCPGFLINRILIPYVNEAVFCLQDGYSMQDIDRAATEFGMPIGPISLADEVGLDVGIKVSEILFNGYGDRMALPKLFDDIKTLHHCLGKKTQEGFYTYYPKQPKKPNPKIKFLITNHQSTPDRVLLQNRLILTLINEASHCLEESIVASPQELDMAMILGTGFPPFRGGLCRYVDSVGVQTIVDRLKELSRRFARFTPSESLSRMAAQNQRFYPD